jgi:hypothetical protein
MRDIRDKLDEGGTVHWDQISVFVTAALLKVRHLPSMVTIREVLHFMCLMERVLRSFFLCRIFGSGSLAR